MVLKDFYPALILCTALFFSCGEKKEIPNSANNEKTDSTTLATDTSAIFTWENGLCYNTGSYDASKYTTAVLENTFRLWFGASGIALEHDGTAATLDDIAKLDPEALTEEYETKKLFLSNPEHFVKSDDWEKLRLLCLQELEDEYALKKITIEAYSNPQVLKNNRFAKHCPDVVKALTATDTNVLFKAWKAFAEIQKQNNGSPNDYMRNFELKWNSTQKIEYARLDLITYGWWNCVNATIRPEHQEDYEPAFKKLFVSVETKCDEP